MPRFKRLIKRVGSTSAIVMFYTPVILYVYAYVLIDGITYSTDNSLTK